MLHGTAWVMFLIVNYRDSFPVILLLINLQRCWIHLLQFIMKLELRLLVKYHARLH